jgi:hypothetical protein
VLRFAALPPGAYALQADLAGDREPITGTVRIPSADLVELRCPDAASRPASQPASQPAAGR